MGFGDSLKKWATSKATEMLTADSQKRDNAAASADAAEQQAKTDVGEQVLRAAFPQVGEWADKQQADQVARDQARDQKERQEIAALPLATVQLSVTGDYATGQWSGQLHLAWKELPVEAPDPDHPSSDPYVTRPGVSVDLWAEDAARPPIGDLALTHWGFQIPGYTGDGSYDLTAIAKEREPAALTYEEWGFEFANADDSSAYFFVDAGQSTVTVSERGKKLTAHIAMSGARGALTVTGEISLSSPAAGSVPRVHP
jgi:hypothetical protein